MPQAHAEEFLVCVQEPLYDPSDDLHAVRVGARGVPRPRSDNHEVQLSQLLALLPFVLEGLVIECGDFPSLSHHDVFKHMSEVILVVQHQSLLALQVGHTQGVLGLRGQPESRHRQIPLFKPLHETFPLLLRCEHVLVEPDGTLCTLCRALQRQHRRLQFPLSLLHFFRRHAILHQRCSHTNIESTISPDFLSSDGDARVQKFLSDRKPS
mmetsp:Transcript_29225/g.57333  ORF Transcript_29225/g.57333 Transcript_29225/m.57333 type:complete len:210 (+) Transcript_29225:984-1613(+)